MDFQDYIEEGVIARQAIDESQIMRIAQKIIDSFDSGGKLIVFGNGGSAADSQHFVAELTGHFLKERKPLPAIALTTNTSSLTAIANDYDYNSVFSRQVLALSGKNDTVIGISTSGNSRNVLEGINAANTLGAYTVGMTGISGGKLKDICREVFIAKSNKTSIIQEIHITAIHMICAVIDDHY
ncbi:D-sedoheptulose 7-phosphate isomerase [Acidiplasma sp.]|uniref:D-sedoheptulose 7-phosphate isomerase n=1 Tax=Acidiplasma sp. TaxID=1872114 RepID=UPI0031609FB9